MATLISRESLRAHLALGDLLTLREAFAELHPADIANEVGGFPPPEAAQLLRALTPAQQSRVFGYFGPQFQIAMARHIARTEFARIVTDMSHDKRADLWKALSLEQRATVLPALAQAEREDIRALNEGDDDAALATLEGARDLPDAAWMAGMIRLRREELDAAKAHFRRALGRLSEMGSLFGKYEIAAQASLPITSDIFAHVFPRERGTRLALVEIAQLQDRQEDAMAHIARLMEIDPTDPVVLLSFAELALDTPDDRALMDRVVRATAHVENETPVDTAILLYRGRAMAALGLPDAAIDVFTLANRRRKDRPEALLHQIRYDRAVLYFETGQRARARREFERIYAADPGFEDVAERLGVGG